MLRILIESAYRWHCSEDQGIRFWSTGSEQAGNALFNFFKGTQNPSLEELCGFLAPLEGPFGFIVDRQHTVFAGTDKVRAYPIFYVQNGEAFAISNSARALRDEFGLSETDEVSLLEFRMSGYVTGRETVYKNLYQLQAGECLIREIGHSGVHCERYYRYFPKRIRSDSEGDLIDELGQVTHRIFGHLIERAEGAPIWVPLSGGLDSRLVLCKLKELGYDRLQSFSYGPPGNHEAKAARHVAEKLEVPWIFVPTRHRGFRTFFHSSLRKQYWSFCDGLCVVPNMQDIQPILELRQKGLLSEESVLVNGQSGDFITGGHIPAGLLEKAPSVSNLLDAVISKHFSLWLHLKTDDALSKIKEKILRLIECPEDRALNREEMIALYEWWEWQERQCKYVVHGQRVYDFVGLSWELPLWEDAYLRFWEDIPVSEKFGQRLYRRYLQKYNYKGLFKDFSPTIWIWPGLSFSVVAAAQVVQWVLGRAWKDRFYNHARYFGHYGPLYAGHGLKYFLRKAGEARNPVSFYADTWIEENGLSSRI